MNYRQLGKSDLRVSEIGFGCMSLNGDEAADMALVHEAMDLGINFFDTADLYQRGQNEILLGKIFRNKRKDIILASKMGNRWRTDGSSWDWVPSKDYILDAANKSLHRLKTDYLDLYQLHGGTLEDPIDDIIDAFEILCKQGKIRYYGISSIRPSTIREYLSRSNIVTVMMQYSLLDRRPEETSLDLIDQQGLSVLARGSLAKGLLINKPPADFLNYSATDVEKMARAVGRVSGAGRTAGQTAIRWVLRRPVIGTAVVGIRTREQLWDAVGTSGSDPLTPEEHEELASTLTPDLYAQHR